MNKFWKIFGSTTILAILAITLIIIFFVCFNTLVVYWLWNWLAPIFWAEAPTLSFLEAFGVACVINFLIIIGRQIVQK